MTSGRTGAAPVAVTVRVPATSANLGPGFDALALALRRYDEITVRRRSSPGVEIEVVGEGAADVPRDETHLVVRAIHAAFHRLGVPRPGLSLRCVNSIPHGRGLGSSAAAIVAGVLAGGALAGRAADDRAWALALANEIEGHPDNVAACLVGGLTMAWTDGAGAHVARLDPSPDLETVAFVPDTEVATATARGLLPPAVPHGDAAHAAGRAALLVEAIRRRPDLLLPATEDRLHQQYRAAAMPGTAALVAKLRDRGVPAVVSGAGPSVLALLRADEEEDTSILSTLAELAGGEWLVMRLGVDINGAQVAVERDD